MKRKPIKHFEALSAKERDKIQWMINRNIPAHVSLKVDGFGLRFGKEADGTFFMATSRSGKIYSATDILDYGQSRAPITRVRSIHYADIFRFLQTSKTVHEMPVNSLVVCEGIYKPMCERKDGLVKQVKVWYNDYRLPADLTLFPIHVEGSVKFISEMMIEYVDPYLAAIYFRVNNPDIRNTILNYDYTNHNGGDKIIGDDVEGYVVRMGDITFKVIP